MNSVATISRFFVLKPFQREQTKVPQMGEAAEDVKREEEIVKVSLSLFRIEIECLLAATATVSQNPFTYLIPAVD